MGIQGANKDVTSLLLLPSTRVVSTPRPLGKLPCMLPKPSVCRAHNSGGEESIACGFCHVPGP